MDAPAERLEPRLRASALMVLRRHGVSADELILEKNEPKDPPSSLIKGHRVRIHVDDVSATFRVRAGRWRGARGDFVSTGALIAAFEEALDRALSG